MSFTPFGTLTLTVYSPFADGSPTTIARRADGGNAGKDFQSTSSVSGAPNVESPNGCAECVAEFARRFVDRSSCGGPRYGKPTSRSVWGPTLSCVIFPFVITEIKTSITSSESARPLLGYDAGRVAS